jgi:hypothetical protein
MTFDKIRELGFPKILYATIAVLALAACCAAAPGIPAVASFTTNASGPGGFIYDGAQMWATDASKGLCRMDSNGGGGGFKFTNCILPPTSKPGPTGVIVTAVLGQPAFDPAGGFVYLPDMSTASRGIWRYHFNGSTFDTPVNIAASLAGQRPGAIALGNETPPNLYATMAGTSSYVRVNTPAALTQTVDNLGVTLSGSPARGIAFVGTQLWIADTGGELLVPNAALCGTKCKGQLDTQVSVPNPLSIAWDAANGYVYIGTSFGVFRHNRADGQTVLYSKFWQTCKNGQPGPCTAANPQVLSGLMTNVTAVGIDSVSGDLYYANDPTASQTVGGAAVYSVPLNSAADGLGFLGTPPVTQLVTESAAPPFANPALLYSTGVTAPKGAVYMGAHVWVVDGAKGFCKVDPTLPAPSLTACVPLGAPTGVSLPAGFVAGSPTYDPGLPANSNDKFVYLADTAGVSGIWKLAFDPVKETVTAAASHIANTALVAAVAGSTAPTALAWGPDGLVYAAMAGTNQILRVNPLAKAPTPKVIAIGSMFEAGSIRLAFHNSDLYNVEVQDSSVIYSAPLCQGNCTSLFVAVVMLSPTSVASDGTFIYFGDGTKVMMFDPTAETFVMMADTGLLADGTPTPFNLVTGIATDGQGHVFAADAANVWEITASGTLPAIGLMAPSMAAEGSTPTVTITGSKFLAAGLVVATCPAITPGSVTVVSSTTITATFAINPVGPLGACGVTVSTIDATKGTTLVSAGSNFTVLVGPPALTSITPPSGFRGDTVPVSIAGANMTNGAINPIPGITITNVAVSDALITANFAIGGTATLGPQSVIVTTPSGPSNALSFIINAKPPVLTSIAPLTGVAGSPLPVTVVLNGTDLFGATVNPPANFTLSGVPIVTATSITASFGIASNVPAGPQSFTVTGPGGTSNAVTFAIKPNLIGIAPASARAGDTTNLVTLTGTSLAGVTSVFAGGNIAITNVAATAGAVTATFTSALNAPLGAQNVTVTDLANGTSNSVTFTLTASVPVLNSIAPLTGGTGATVPITLSGTGLLGATLNLPVGITLSGVPVTSFGQVTANIVLAGNAPLGNQFISVTTPGAGNTSNAVTFNVFALAPLLNTIAPTKAGAGSTTTVTLTGRGFTGTTSVNTVVGGGIAVNPGGFMIVSDTQITATFVIDPSATTQQISVTNPNGTSNSLTFGIVPTLTSISPNSKPAGLNQFVTLTGSSLTGATAINTGTAGITVTGLTVVSSTTITATFSIASNATQGVHLITVSTPGGPTGTQNFTVLPPPPTITSLNGPFKRASNQGVTLAGTNLAGATAFTAVQVLLNGNAVTTTSWAVSGFQISATQLRWNWTIPAAATAGNYTMTVTTPSGTTTPFGFTVQ